MDNKYEDLDKQVTKKVMAEVEGSIVLHQCPDCKGEKQLHGEPCKQCDGEGEYYIEY